MAFAQSGLRVFALGGNLSAGAKSPKLCHFITADAIATVVASGYFNAAAAQLAIGDVIIASCGSGATLTTLNVATNDGTTVTTTKSA